MINNHLTLRGVGTIQKRYNSCCGLKLRHPGKERCQTTARTICSMTGALKPSVLSRHLSARPYDAARSKSAGLAWSLVFGAQPSAQHVAPNISMKTMAVASFCVPAAHARFFGPTCILSASGEAAVLTAYSF